MERASSVATVLVALVVVSGPVAGATTTGAAGTEGNAQADLVTLTIDVQTEDGEPVAGAAVEVTYDGGSNTTQTFSNGQALVDVPRGVDAIIDIDHETYVINRPVGVASVDEDQTVDVIAYRKATAVVEVTDDSGVVRNAQVTLQKEDARDDLGTGTTGENGLYQADDIESGTYQVTVVKRGYAREVTDLEVGPPSSGTTVVLEEASVTLDARVFDDHFRTEQPLAEATVEVVVDGQTVRSGLTGDSGRVQLSIGANGRYLVRVTKDGYTTVEREIVVGESGTAGEFRIQRTPALDVELGADSVVAGESVLVQVQNAYGETVEDAVITRNGEEVGRTDARGELRVMVPDTGEYDLVASKDGVSSDPATVEGFEAATTTTEATPTSETTDAPSDPLPGFGPALALVAALLALLLLRRRE